MRIPQLMMYIRPQEYYDNLSKKLNESTLAKTSAEAAICLSSGLDASDETALVSGLVNTGNSCFLNSVLQAMSSLPQLHLYLAQVNYVSTGISLPVTRSLLKTIRSLAKPLEKRTSFRPVDIVTALSSNRRIISREQQDAQEFFQIVSSAIDVEGQKIAKTDRLGGGLKDVLSPPQSIVHWIHRKRPKHHAENPFTGLLANRLSCMQCGYTGAIRHFSFNNIQLNVPNKYTTTLQECLSQFTSMEYLQDASCRKCSFEITVKSLEADIEKLQYQSKKLKKSDVKKKRELVVQLVSLEKAKQQVEYRLKMGRIEEEDDQDRLPLLRSVSRMSSKQVMLAKPPKILCLHISRSAFLNTGAVYKNTCQLMFPEYLDVSPFSTNGTLHTQPNVPISIPEKNTTYYRLMSVIVHYGSHSFGHYVAFKRRIFADQCQCHGCQGDGQPEEWKCQNTWYRISDSKVDECSLEDVLRSNPYMLLYELTEEEQEVALSDDSSEEVVIDYNIPTKDDATREALRIANSLMMGDQHDMLLAANKGTAVA
ncbi:uncharacterized protein B0P05DRAFT_584969 [Gilbertella persicaria]|uniref:Ubiquitin carboxyl-terminal hydrolase n=1 Tax=Rhizopus stolonifer TaxID=4846 RepID=A0A367JZZ1_RHIST|nr:uncharacterized protein B0P05DRAFT_584969 [Gilbertella persicaria]KAI8087750.1 hypothetical protein B0P05DRAFT_584969 [Gilbertella persicaria]RCH95513.1 hypothetical protein CU098_009598 [Rhizopus stolonifer]